MSEKISYSLDQKAPEVTEAQLRNLCSIIQGFLDNFGEDIEKNDTRVASFRNSQGDEITLTNARSADKPFKKGYSIVTTVFAGTENYTDGEIEHYLQKTFYLTPEEDEPYYWEYWLEEDSQGEIPFKADEDLPLKESLSQDSDIIFSSCISKKAASYYDNFVEWFGSDYIHQDDLDFIHSLLADDSFTLVAPRIYI